MLPRSQDPIVAIATASGRGAVGIVRVSGLGLTGVVQALCGRELQARMATYVAFRAADSSVIDQGLAVFFPEPNSYTGESVLELQAHGGPVVLQMLVARCLEAGAHLGLRLAEPGEFTQRAFLNEKLDLAQAEAVSDLIDAGTEAAARSASRSLSGAFSAEIQTLRERLLELRMLVEATLDFPDEEIDFLEKADARGQLEGVALALRAVLVRARQGALLREGIQVVLAGQPNVGKSSLLNALAGAELAIVTAVPGTTRDKVAQTIQIEGVPLHVIDTAGLRDSLDEVERIGVARSWVAIGQADAVLFVHDLERTGEVEYDRAEAVIAGRLSSAMEGGQAGNDRILHVYNKADLVAGPAVKPGIRLSTRTGAGLDNLRRRLLEMAGWQAQPEGVYTARARHLLALRRCALHVEQARTHAAASGTALDLLAEELRLAHDALGEITGVCTPDALLGEIFGRFCLGK